MTIQLNKESLMRSKKKKALAAGLLVAGMMATSLMLAAKPAHAAGTTFTVDSAAEGHDLNPGDGVCDTIPDPALTGCTIRAAIEEANVHPGADTINFNLGGTGVRNISVGTSFDTKGDGLPRITDTVTIDGYSEPGSSPNTLTKGSNAVLAVQLDGTSVSAGIGRGLQIEAPNSVVRGLVINHFKEEGILVKTGADGSKIEGNFIGTDASGTQDLGNDASGVTIEAASNVTVGGASPAARNLISGNDADGVFISNSTGSKVLGSLIGTKKDSASNLGNTFHGVRVNNGSSNTIIGDGTAGGANTIAFNGADGFSDGVSVFADAGTGNRILSNSIFSNSGLGIDLANNNPTPNVPGDVDSGPNNLQNFPELNFAVASGSQTFVSGTLDSTPSKTFNVQVFSSLQKDPTGFGEGQAFLGEKEVTTDASGKASFLLAAPKPTAVGSFVTATATSASGDTSEFSEGKVASPLKKKKKHHKKRH